MGLKRNVFLSHCNQKVHIWFLSGFFINFNEPATHYKNSDFKSRKKSKKTSFCIRLFIYAAKLFLQLKRPKVPDHL